MTKKNRMVKHSIAGAVASRLIKVRKQLNYTPREMAARLGISGSAYNKNETGENLPGVSTIQVLLKDFDISLDWLYFNKGPMHFKSKLKAAELKSEREKLAEEAKRVKMESEKIKKRGEVAMKFSQLGDVMPDITDFMDEMISNPQYRHKVLLEYYTYKSGKKEPGQDSSGDS